MSFTRPEDPATVEREPLGALLDVEVCKIVANQSLAILPPVLAAQLLIAACAYGRAPHWMVVAWLAAVLAVHVARLTVLRRILLNERYAPGARVRFAVVLSVVSGCAHASSALFLPHLTLHLQAVQYVVLLGLCAGCVAVNVGRAGIVAGFIGPIGLALAAFWISRLWIPGGTWEAAAIGVLTLFLALTLLALSRDTYRTFAHSVEIRLENTELALRLELALRVAEAASHAKTRFLASASHDLRQPLHTLAFLTAALELRPLDDKGRDILQNMSIALEVLSSEFDMLLDISKLDAGVVTVSPSTFEVNALIARANQTFQAMAEAKGLSLHLSWPASTYVSTDKLLLERIVRNLIDNAIKYTRSGSVKLSVGSEGSVCTIKVEDTGIGVAPPEQERIFEEFYQIDNPERDRRKGLGLGLPIVRRLSALLGLDLEMRSTPGKGTTFLVRLPCLPPPPVQEVPPRLRAPASFTGMNFLIIDDEADSREAMKGYLEGLGGQVAIAATVNEAAALAQMQEPDLVVADFRLRGSETGLQAIDLLRRSRRDLPALLITGDTAPDRLAEISASGISVLHKPVPPAMLVDRITRLLQSPTAIT